MLKLDPIVGRLFLYITIVATTTIRPDIQALGGEGAWCPWGGVWAGKNRTARSGERSFARSHLEGVGGRSQAVKAFWRLSAGEEGLEHLGALLAAVGMETEKPHRALVLTSKKSLSC